MGRKHIRHFRHQKQNQRYSDVIFFSIGSQRMCVSTVLYTWANPHPWSWVLNKFLCQVSYCIRTLIAILTVYVVMWRRWIQICSFACPPTPRSHRFTSFYRGNRLFKSVSVSVAELFRHFVIVLRGRVLSLEHWNSR